MNQIFVEFAVRDYNKPMGVATYRASKDMPERLRNALPDIEDLKSYCKEKVLFLFWQVVAFCYFCTRSPPLSEFLRFCYYFVTHC